MSEAYKPKKIYIPFNWEEIDQGDREYEPDTYARTKVIGGWLIFTQRYEHAGISVPPAMSTNLCFIPDAEHSWEIGEEGEI